MNKKGKKEQRIAAKLIMDWVCEAKNDLDSPYFKRLPSEERRKIQHHIHRYGYIIGLILRCRYNPED